MPELNQADLNSSITTLNLPLIGVIEAIHATYTGSYEQWWLDLIVKAIAG